MRSFKITLFLIVSSMFVLASVSAQAAPCDVFLLLEQRAEKKAAKLQQAKDKLEQLVEEQLVKAGFTPNDDLEVSRRINKRISNLASLIDPYQFQNKDYLNFWIEKLINLKISENLKPVDDKNLGRPEREALNRMILREMILRGVATLQIEKQPSRREQFLKFIRQVRHNKAFRTLVEWRLPRETVYLSDEMIADIAENGVLWTPKGDSDLGEVVLRNAVRVEHRSVRIQELNTLVVMISSLYFMNLYYERFSPAVQAAYEKAYSEQVQINTKEFKDTVKKKSSVDREAVKLGVAVNEIKITEDDILARFGSPATATEKLEIRYEICIERFGKILSEESEAQCLAAK